VPFTGGWSPSPEKTGAGLFGRSPPLLQRVFESIAAQRGSAYDQTLTTAVGVENLAYARAITYDVHEASRRLANEFIAATGAGLLPRWEKIFNVPPAPGDTETVRRARVAAAWLRIGAANPEQAVSDALTAALGSLFVSLEHQDTSNYLSYQAGITPVVATGTTPPTVTITGTPLFAANPYIAITTGGALGTALFKWGINGGASFLQTGETTAASYPLTYGLTVTGLTASFSSVGSYAVNNTYSMYCDPAVPWMSTIRLIGVLLTIPNGYQVGAIGSNIPNAAWYAAVGANRPILDLILPADCTYNAYIHDSAGNIGFLLDDPSNLDNCAFGV
jgi:hypothetical protein